MDKIMGLQVGKKKAKPCSLCALSKLKLWTEKNLLAE